MREARFTDNSMNKPCSGLTFCYHIQPIIYTQSSGNHSILVSIPVVQRTEDVISVTKPALTTLLGDPEATVSPVELASSTGIFTAKQIKFGTLEFFNPV